jgi:hypothetical protein
MKITVFDDMQWIKENTNLNRWLLEIAVAVVVYEITNER